MLRKIKQISQINGLLLHGPQIEKQKLAKKKQKTFERYGSQADFPLGIP